MVSAARAHFEPVFTQGVESEVDVDTALTRARQARSPSPWTGRGRWKSRERENATRSATEPGLRAEPLGEAQKSLRGAHGERSERLKMQVSDCVDTALTRARQARSPSPWTGRGIWKSRERENAAHRLLGL